MSKVKDYIDKEKREIGEILYKINGAIAEIAPFIDENTLKNRKYFNRVDYLKNYTKFLDEMAYKEDKDGVLGFLNDSKRISEINQEKLKYLSTIEQLKKCSECRCLNCIKTCKFDSCLGCRDGAHVESCNKENFNIVLHSGFTLSLVRDESGNPSNYNVLATMQDLSKDKRYIIIQDIASGEKFILYYYPGISQNDFGEIRDENEFNSIVEAFERIKR